MMAVFDQFLPRVRRCVHARRPSPIHEKNDRPRISPVDPPFDRAMTRRRLCVAIRRLPVAVRDRSSNAADLGIPSFIDFARLKLDLNDLTTGVVNAGADHESLLPAVQPMVHGDDVPRQDLIGRGGRQRVLGHYE